MSERQILEMGIRAMGVVLLIRALTDQLGRFTPTRVVSSESLVISAIPAVGVLVAMAMVRYATQIASRLREPDTVEPGTTTFDRGAWDRWLLVSAGVYAIAAIGIRPLLYTASALIYAAKTNVTFPTVAINMREDFAFTVLRMALQLLLPFAIMWIVLLRPQWIVGKRADVV